MKTGINGAATSPSPLASAQRDPALGPPARMAVARAPGRTAGVWAADITTALHRHGVMVIDLDEGALRRRIDPEGSDGSYDAVLSASWTLDAATFAHRHRAALLIVPATAVDQDLFHRMRSAPVAEQTVIIVSPLGARAGAELAVFQDLRAVGPTEIETETSRWSLPHGLEIVIPDIGDGTEVPVVGLPGRDIIEHDVTEVTVRSGSDTVVTIDGRVRPDLSPGCLVRRSVAPLATVILGAPVARW